MDSRDLPALPRRSARHTWNLDRFSIPFLRMDGARKRMLSIPDGTCFDLDQKRGENENRDDRRGDSLFFTVILQQIFDQRSDD